MATLKIRNENGEFEEVPSLKGTDGTSAYLHIRYGATATPAELLTTPNTYIGIAVSSSATAPADHTGYTWYQWRGDDGQDGADGDPGKDFPILGYYADLTALQAAVTAPDAGDAYGIGSAAPYDIYVYDGVNLTWVNNGAIQGPKGDTGESGATFIPSVSAEGEISWTNDKGLTNPTTRNIKGPKGDQGDTGDPGPNTVSTTTDTSITGLLKGTGSKVAQAVAGTDYAAANHTHSAYLDKSGGTLTGAVAAHNGTDYGTARVRNISAGTADLTAGSSALASGDIYFVYE